MERQLEEARTALEAGKKQEAALTCQLETLQETLRALEEQRLPELRQAVEASGLRRDRAGEALEAAQKERRKLEQETGELEEATRALERELEELRSRRERLGRNKTDREQELERLRLELQKFDNECARLQEQIDRLNHDLTGKNLEQLRANFQKTIGQKQEILSQCHTLELRIQEEQQAAEDQRRKQETARQHYEELRRQTEEEHRSARDRQETLRREIEALQEKQEKLGAQERALETQRKNAEEVLRGLHLEGYMDRLQRLRERNNLLLEARAALETDLQEIMAARNLRPDSLDMSFFQEDFRRTEQWVAHYQTLFGNVLSQLSGDSE